ncbi:MAG TPA: hypothetical protein VFO65_01100, partial [Acidimicrobiales bacterium]|nr:hypothetical protein [Acidimicrobiales bacterium]
RAAVRQQVSGLRVRVDPRWTELLATGWRPADARMAIVDVSGRLSIRRGDDVRSEPFALQLLVGSARWRDGYGTVSVFGWEVGSA